MKVLGLVWFGWFATLGIQEQKKKGTRGLVCIDHKEIIKCSDLYLSLRDIYILVFIFEELDEGVELGLVRNSQVF